ncbi:MAG: AsmA family protein, partial [Nitratireductor sp.]
MKKLFMASLVLLLLLTAVIFALPLVISSESVKTSLLAHAQKITGREMQFTGNPQVSFRPFLGIEINNVVFHDQFGPDGSKPLLQMPKLKGKLSLTAALTGQVEMSEFQFVRPLFNLKKFSTGQTSWHFPEGKVWDSLAQMQQLISNQKPGEAIDMSQLRALDIGSFSILDGVLEYENEINGSVETFTNLNASSNWNTTNSAWTFSGSTIWRGDLMEFQSSVSTPLMLMAGGVSDIEFDVKSEPINLEYTGKINNQSNLYFDGEVALTSPSLRRVLNLLGNELEPSTSLGQFSLAGMLTGTLNEMKIQDSNISINADEANGNVSYRLNDDGKMRLNGTLAFAEINLAPYIGEGSDSEAVVGSGLSSLHQLDQLEMDLRISSEEVVFNKSVFTNFAGGLITKAGKLTLDIGNTDFAEGTMVGSISAERIDNELEFATNINLSEINTAQLMPSEFETQIWPMAKGNIDLMLKSSGKNSTELTRNLTGDLEISLQEGELDGVNLQAIKSQEGEKVVAV